MRRKVGLFLGCAMVLPLAGAATAYGQGATLRVSDQTPAPGQTITVTGNGFSTNATGNGPVKFRLDSRTSEPIGDDTAPDPNGQISQSIPIPSGTSPGWHLLIATQTTTLNGRAAAFTPGRVRLDVGAPGTGAAAPPGGGGGSPRAPSGLLALTAGLIVLAAGATLTVRRIRTHNRPQLSGEAR